MDVTGVTKKLVKTQPPCHFEVRGEIL